MVASGVRRSCDTAERSELRISSGLGAHGRRFGFAREQRAFERKRRLRANASSASAGRASREIAAARLQHQHAEGSPVL
jgi:hypothetical protein